MEKERTMSDMIAEIVTAFTKIFHQQAYTKHILCDPRYRELMEAACEAEQRYLNLELTEAQRAIVDETAQKKLDAGIYENQLTYLAEAVDAVHFLLAHGFLDALLDDSQELEI